MTSRTFAALLLLVAGIGSSAGGLALRRGGAEAWPDVVANTTVVRRTALVLLVFGVAFVVAAFGVALRARWGLPVSLGLTAVVLLASFWGNVVLFGSIRPLHTGTNVLVAALIWWLVLRGYR